MSLDEEDDHRLGAEEDDDDGGSRGVDGDDGDIGPDSPGVTTRGNRQTAQEVNTETFHEMELLEPVREALLSAWELFLLTQESHDAAGETLLAAIFEAAPSIHSLFRTARAVMALRFMNGLGMVMNALADPKSLKVVVETLGFQHMDIEVTVPHVIIFREAVTEVLLSELGARFTTQAQAGWHTVMNYVGGAFIYLRLNCASRLRILASSWATANGNRQEIATEESEEQSIDAVTPDGSRHFLRGSTGLSSPRKDAGLGSGTERGRDKDLGWNGDEEAGSGKTVASKKLADSIPTTFEEMFRFNAAVMGFAGHAWMNEILLSFDTIVTNAANTYRLQEECDVVSLRMGKYGGNINLAEYKAVMLASLRSLVPRHWNSAYEVAWSWLWDNVAQLLQAMIGHPVQMQLALERLWEQLEEAQLHFLRRELYNHFFTQAPAGQEFFKQSTTRLHFISDLVRSLTLDIYKDPQKTVSDISGIGLRHVGYGIPVDLIAPFVTSWLQVVRRVTEDPAAEQAFSWSLSLIARIMKRVISEGSTIVMKAINANSGKQLQRAIGCAPRGKRASWVLNVQVGTQRISPFMWALESGSLEAAQAIIVDLLTIRADRDRYYYAVDALFGRHPDVIQRLSIDAPSLLPTLLDGLIWRSRITEKGMRRVNYYLKHLIVDANGEFSKAVEWLTDLGDPKVACHPAVSLVMDLVWSGAAYRTFLLGKTWLLFCVLLFVTAQSFLNRWEDIYGHFGRGGRDVLVDHNPTWMRITIFGMRVFLYTCSMGRWCQYHALHIYRDYCSGELMQVLGGFRVPSYLATWQNRVSLLLALSLFSMFVQCPVLYCLDNPVEQVIAQRCERSKSLLTSYSICSAITMVLYFLLLTDVAVFSTRISAFVLVCGRVLSEVGLFVIGIAFTALTFAAAISTMEQYNPSFAGLPRSLLSLLEITLGMFDMEEYKDVKEPEVILAIFIYILCTAIFLVNLLVAQLSCVYQASYADLLGFARLNRGRILVEAMPRVAKPRWAAFVQSLRLNDPIEFGEGDVGIAGGVQVLEPGNANPTTVDMIKRYGGSTARSAPWPAEVTGMDDQDLLERLEKTIELSNKRMNKILKLGARIGGSGGNSSAANSTFGLSGGSVESGEL